MEPSFHTSNGEIMPVLRCCTILAGGHVRFIAVVYFSTLVRGAIFLVEERQRFKPRRVTK